VNIFLSERIAVDVIQAALADGQTDPDSDSIDMQGWDGCLFIGSVGTITGAGTVDLTVEGSADDSSFAALSGATAQASAAADSDKILAIDVLQPKDTDRYLRTALTRGTANSVYNGTLAMRYRAREFPTTWTAADLAADLVQVHCPDDA
jgi:hypothetical protein